MIVVSRWVRVLAVMVPVLVACGTSDTDQVIIEPPVASPDMWDAAIATPGVPAEAAGVLAIPNRGDFRIAALNPATGQSLWTRALPDGTSDFGSFGDLFVAYRANAADSAVATFIDPVDGFDVWTQKLARPQPVFVMRINQTIVASINDSVLVGLDRRSGQQSWRVSLGRLTCTPGALCGRLRGIGVDRGDGFILRQSSVEAQIVTVRETGLVGQVVSPSATLRQASASDVVSTIAVTGTVVVQSQGSAAGIDATTGVERWTTSFSTLVPATFSPQPSAPSFTSDGAYLIAPLADATSAREIILDARTGQVAHQRTITHTQFAATGNPCGPDGYAYLRDDGNGFEFVNIRTGVATAVTRPALTATVTSAGLTNAFASNAGVIVFSKPFSTTTRHYGVKCSP